MKKCRAFCYVVSAVFLAVVVGVAGDAAAEEAAKKTRDEIAKLSLIEQAPIVVNINRRYYKFYGDPNTVNGGILERNYLTDNWLGGGLRDKLVESGVYFDVRSLGRLRPTPLSSRQPYGFLRRSTSSSAP